MKLRTLVPLLGIAAVLLGTAVVAACGGDDNDAEPPTPPAAAASPSPEPTSTEAAPTETTAPATATASATPPPAATATQEPDCPVPTAVCALAETISAHLESDDYEAVVDLMQAREETCPGGTPQGAGGPFPLCDGAPQGEVRSGYQIARRYSEGGIVNREGLELFLRGAGEGADASASDQHGDGGLRLQAVSCAQQPATACELGTVVFTGIYDGTRELLIFWIPLPADPATPLSSVWNGIILPDEGAIVFETGGNLFDLGEVHLVEGN